MNDRILMKYRDFVWGKYPKTNTRRTMIDHPTVMVKHIGKPLKDITQGDIDKYVRWCYENRKHNGNVIRFWSIKQCIKWARKNRYITRRLRLPKLNPVDAGKQALQSEDVDRLLEAVEKLSPLHRLVTYLCIDALRRPSTIINLKIRDRTGDRLSYEGKTADSIGRQVCTMTERLKKSWDDYISQIRPIPMTPEDAEYLILSDYGRFKGKRLVTRTMITRIIRETCMFAQVTIPDGEKPTCYLFKRTGITEQLKICPDPKIVMHQAGHTKLDTTMKYNRIREEDIKEHINLFEHKRKRIKEKVNLGEHESF